MITKSIVTVGQLIEALKAFNPDTVIQLMNDNRGTDYIIVEENKRNSCDGPYIICELTSYQED